MKKLNIQVYQGDPSGLVTKDNNNLFIEGDVQYSTGAGTIVKSVTSIKNSNGDEIMSGGGMVDTNMQKFLTDNPRVKSNGSIIYYDLGVIGEEFSIVGNWHFNSTPEDGIDIGDAHFHPGLDIKDLLSAYRFVLPTGMQFIAANGSAKYKITMIKDVEIINTWWYIEISPDCYTFEEIIG